MRILGIGVDMVKNRRIGNLLNDKRFINRTFSEVFILFDGLYNTLFKLNFFRNSLLEKKEMILV